MFPQTWANRATYRNYPPGCLSTLGAAATGTDCDVLDIECRAGAGASAAVKPWLVAAVTLGVVGAAVGTIALVRSF